MRPDPGAPRPSRRWLVPGLVLPEGLEAGLLGGLAVVLVYLVRDVWIGQPMHTPSVLGTLLLDGLEAARTVRFDGPAAIGYHAAHFAAWAALGFAASAVFALAEERPQLGWLPLAGLVLALLLLSVLDGLVGETLLARPHLWVGGIAGLAAMGAFLVWRHPDALPRR
jgi:hypothetical protein